MSPSMFIPQAISPSFMQLNMLCGPGSPLYGAMAAGAKLEAMRQQHNPLNQMNQMRMPFGVGAPMTSLANNMQDGTSLKRSRDSRKKEEHIKKPLNAFMWFMKENRPKMIEEMGFKVSKIKNIR